jgi:DNA-directed RNA polymerase alpha subunit
VRLFVNEVESLNYSAVTIFPLSRVESRRAKSLIDAGFSVRAIHALEAHGITTIEELSWLQYGALLELRNIGYGTVVDITAVLLNNRYQPLAGTPKPLVAKANELAAKLRPLEDDSE